MHPLGEMPRGGANWPLVGRGRHFESAGPAVPWGLAANLPENWGASCEHARKLRRSLRICPTIEALPAYMQERLGAHCECARKLGRFVRTCLRIRSALLLCILIRMDRRDDIPSSPSEIRPASLALSHYSPATDPRHRPIPQCGRMRPMFCWHFPFSARHVRLEENGTRAVGSTLKEWYRRRQRHRRNDVATPAPWPRSPARRCGWCGRCRTHGPILSVTFFL
jgi:hypothetical protein